MFEIGSDGHTMTSIRFGMSQQSNWTTGRDQELDAQSENRAIILAIVVKETGEG